MTHEFKEIIEYYEIAKQQGIPTVMATVVDVVGSSYRRPGVGMLILKNGISKGAVSGGCVEKEVFRQAQTVFETGISKMMTYDGKYRLGCEGLLYILIEIFDVNQHMISAIKEHLEARIPFTITSYYSINDDIHRMGSVIRSENDLEFTFSQKSKSMDLAKHNSEEFRSVMMPCFRLIIIGIEHDAQKLCQLAWATGWEIEVVGSPKKPKTKEDFPETTKIWNVAPDNLAIKNVDQQTAFVLMSHNFAKDLLYLQAITNYNPVYIGLLGPAKRREKLLSALIEYNPEVSNVFLDNVRGPAGLNLGSETPEEIAISIIAEILSIIRNQKPISLQDKKGAIHDDPKRKPLDAVKTRS